MARKRRLRTLLALWAAYWAGLAAFEAGPVLWEYLRLQATEGHGTVSWSFSGSLTMLTLALVGPPLVLWALWLAVPERDERRTARHVSPGQDGEGALPVEEQGPRR